MNRAGAATYAFIHGAGDVGWYWHLVAADLRERGHDVVAPDLPIEDDGAGLSEYADTVVDAIGDRGDVIVVAQSFGGYVAPIVCDRVPARLLVLVAGMVPAPGETAEEMFASTGWQPDDHGDPSTIAVFYHDVAPDLAAEAIRRAATSRRHPGESRGRCRRGRTFRRATCCAGTTASSRRRGSAESCATASTSRPTRSTADTVLRSVDRMSWPIVWRSTGQPSHLDRYLPELNHSGSVTEGRGDRHEAQQTTTRGGHPLRGCSGVWSPG